MTIWRRWPVCGILGAVLLLACAGSATEETAPGTGTPSSSPPPEAPETANRRAELAGSEQIGVGSPSLGPGFVVWESNRSGAWRIWARRLDGGPPRQLSPEESGRTHCCAHISPNGNLVAYLSGEEGDAQYPADGMLGALHLIAPDGTGDREVSAAARSYFENRAVVWRSNRELIHIDGERATVTLNLDSGETRQLAEPPAERAWLIDATLSWATTGRPEFAPYDADRRRVVPRRRLGGCQPFFTRDGRWGYWTAGAGGPIRRLDLASGQFGRILGKNDPRAPDGFGYAYFPMVSADGRLFAWAASRGGHDHFQTDYEVFVAESDPDTLDLIGPPQRITHDAAADRFPDAWQPPLELGRHGGEAPLTVRLTAPAGGSWEWRFGDGQSAEGPGVEHTWTEPGRYPVAARRDEETLSGLVVVRPKRPPQALAAAARAGGQEVVVTFDEPIDAAGAELDFASGRAISGHETGADGRSLVLALAQPLRGLERLSLAGVRDLAQQANPMAPTTLEVEPPTWPVSQEGLAFLWQTADAANLVPDPELGADRSYTLAATGSARLDAHFAMVLDGGSFVLARDEASRPGDALRATNELSLEATIVPRGGDGRIITWAGKRAINLWLEERAGRLVFGLRTGGGGPDALPRVELFDLPKGDPTHVVVSYEPGRLVGYLDGELVVDSREAQGGLYHWRDLPLSFGDGGWPGLVESVAIYDRILDAAEVAEAYRLQLASREARPVIPRSVVVARLAARSRTPTLSEISPYREALITVDYEVESTLEGPPVSGRARAVQWAVQDGQEQTVTRASPGDRWRLTLEPFSLQPQLEAIYLADTLAGGSGQLLYVVDAAPVR